MTTINADTIPSIREVALMKLAIFMRDRAKRASNTSNQTTYRVNTVLSSVIRVMLHLAGFGLLTMAGFQWNMIAGLIVAGVSCFALSSLMTSGGGDNAAGVSRAPDLRRG